MSEFSDNLPTRMILVFVIYCIFSGFVVIVYKINTNI